VNILPGRSDRAHIRHLAALLVFMSSPVMGLAALDVATSEVETTRNAKIDFVNYEGPQSIIQTAAEIRDIGASLGAAIGKPDGMPGRAGDFDRYAVIRAVDAATAVGLDADIIVIGKNAVVDNIDNVRRIVAGYLEVAWGYSRADAATLAVFITVYNAVHRGDIAYFGTKYKVVVTKELSVDDAGLATRWDEWPGRTRILIPLSSGAQPGAAGAVSTGTISGKEVTQGMKTEPGNGIPARQALVTIKQKEVAQSQDQAAKAKEEAAAAAAQAAAAQVQLAQAQKDLATAKTAAAQSAQSTQPAQVAAPPTPTTQGPAPAVAAAAAAPSPVAAATQPAAPSQSAAAAPAAPPATPNVAAAQVKVAEAQKAVETAQAQSAAKTVEAQKAEAAAASKQAEIASDRQSITADQNAAIAAQVSQSNSAATSGILLLEIVDSSYPFARIDLVDPKTGKLIRASTVNSIRSRSFVDGGSVFVAVAGKEGGTGAVRLIAIDKKTLAQLAQSDVDIHPESVVAKIGDAFYAVSRTQDGTCYLSRFGADLKETARSKDAVDPFTFVVQGPDGIIAQSAAGGFISLDATSLAVVRKLGL